jgi:hypothetical protein
MANEAWAKSQLRALLDLGVSPIDAQRSVKWVLANLPRDADPATYIFPAGVLWQEPSSREAVQDARVYVYSADGFSSKYKTILDARGTE